MGDTEKLETVTVGEPVVADVTVEDEAKVKKKSKKERRAEKKRLQEILAEPLAFKKIDFDHALTKDEKSARKAARQAKRDAKRDAKSGKKPKPKAVVKTVENLEGQSEKPVEIGEIIAEDKPDKKEKTEKKEKKKKKSKKDKDQEKDQDKDQDKKKSEEEEDVPPETIVDLLRRRASVAQEVKEKQERRQSVMLERRASKMLERRKSKAELEPAQEIVQIAGGQEGEQKPTESTKDTKKKRVKKDSKTSEESETSEKKEKGKKKRKPKVDDQDTKPSEQTETSEDNKEGKKRRKSKVDQSNQVLVKSEDSIDTEKYPKGKRRKSGKDLGSVSFAGALGSSYDFMDTLLKSNSNVEMDESYTSIDGEVDGKKKKKRKKKAEKSTERLADKSSEKLDKKKEKKETKDEKKKDKEIAEGPTKVESKVDKSDVKIVVKKDVKTDIKTDVKTDVKRVEAQSEGESVKGKGKGKKKKKVEVQEEKVEEEMSVFDQIALMKAQAAMTEAVPEAPTEVTETTEKTKKSKKSKKSKTPSTKEKVVKGPKLSKKERLRAEWEKAERARIQAELDAAAAAIAEKKRLEKEKKIAIEKDKRDIYEQQIRVEQLHGSTNFIQFLCEKKAKQDKIVKREEEWVEYLKCDGLPDPSNCAVMNTYLHLWEKDLPTAEIKEAERRTDEVLKLLEVLDYIIEAPYLDEVHKVDNWIWVRSLTRAHQHENLESVTYRLLRDINQNLIRLNIPTSEFRFKSTNFSLCLWLLVQLPIPVPNPRTPARPRIDLDFPEMGMKVCFPTSLECVSMAIRAMYVKYDHLSDTCQTHARPPIPEEYQQNLLQSINSEWHAKLLYKYERRKRPEPQEITLEDGTVTIIEPEPEPELQEGALPPIVPYQRLDPTASAWVINFEDSLYADHRERLLQTTLSAKQAAVVSISLSSGELLGASPETVLNLREMIVLGGVYNLQVYYQPPQPLGLVSYEMIITALQKPLRLRDVPFFADYKPSPPIEVDDSKSPEELEEEIKQQEAEINELILVTLNMPQHIVWLDVPQICYWDEVNRVWRTDNIYDFKHIAEKNCVSFRTGIFGQFALATNKYASLPYQAWELRPEIDGTVTLQLTTAILLIEFNVKGSLVSLARLQNGPNKALQDIVGIYYKLPKLRMLMVQAGVDVFPAFDAFCYVDGTCEKHWPMETHLYYNMAQLSNCFNFAWSRWNLTAGRRTIIFQMREFKPDKVKQRNHLMLMVTPLKALLVDCTEVSETFNETGIEDMNFCSDLYCVMKSISNVTLRNKIQRNPSDLVNAVAQLLIETRIFSFS